jgi:hypothetical protein
MKQFLQLIRPFREMRKMAFFSFVLFALIAIPMGMRGQTTTLVSGSGTSGYSIPDGWTSSGTVEGGSYLKFDDGTITSPEFAPHNGLSFTYSVATFGSGTNHPLTIRILNASTNAVISETTTATPSSSSYINTGSPLSLGDVAVAFKIQIYGPTGKGVRLRNYSVTGTPSGGQQLTPSDLALVDAPVELEFDLYDNANAQTISYTTSSTGAVTVSQSNYITATVNANNTITVTPVAVTNGPQTITVNQASDNTYAAGSVTFTVDIEDNSPNVTFLAGTDVGSTTANNSPDQMVKDGVTVNSTDAAFATAQYRLYQNSTTTISVASGTITNIVFNGQSTSYPVSKLSIYGNNGSYTDNNNVGTWTGNADEVSFSASGQVRLSSIVVTVETSGTPDPTILASNVDITYNATSGSIAYTINNEPSPAGTLTAAVTEGNWLTLGQGTTSPIDFTCAANENTTARTATVTLTYTYGTDQTITSNVTITQAAAPVIYTTIPSLFEAATSTETNVLVTFNNWVVSGVSTNGKNVFVTDNSGNGFVIYSNEDMRDTYAAGSILSGTAVSCSLKKYNGFAELLNVNANDLTIATGGNVTEANVAMADLSGVNTGALLHYDSLTCSINNNKYYLSDGTTTLQLYNALYAFDSLVVGKTYNITGVYQQYNSTKEILPRSAADIEEAVATEPSVTVTPNTINAPADGADGTLALTYENITDFISFDYYFCDAEGNQLDVDPDWIYAEINEEDDTYTLDYVIDANDGAARTAYIKVYTFDDDLEEVSAIVTVSQAAASVVPSGGNYVRITSLDQLTDGSIVVIAARYDEDHTNGYYAMPSVTSGKPNGVAFISETSGDNEILPADITTSEDTYYWVVNVTNDGYTFTNVDGQMIGYSSSTNFATGGSNTTWTITRETAIEQTMVANYTGFVIRNGNTNTRAFAFNGQAFGAYATSNMTTSGQPAGYNFYLDFFMQSDETPESSITVNPDMVDENATEHEGTLALTYENLEISDMEDFGIQYYDAEGEEIDEPDWVEVTVAAQDPQIGEGYVVSYYMINNEGDARTAYFKVFALGNEDYVYSNLVTVAQAAPIAVTVTITGNTNTVDYDGEEHSVSGYTVTAIEIDGVATELYTENDFTFNGTASAARTVAGTTYMGLTSNMFTNTNANFSVTFDVTDGYLTIEKASMTVAVTGHTDTVTYNGSEQSVSGYSLSCESELYNDTLVSYSGETEVTGTAVGTYPMGLEAERFSYGNSNINVAFNIVNDGGLEITANTTAITVIPGSGSRVYDGTPFTMTEHDDFTVTGVPESFSWTATADGTVTNVIPGAGEKAVNAVTSFHIFDADGNDVTAYFTNITYQSGTLAITPKSVVITVNDATKTYGETDPDFTGTVVGLDNPDALASFSYIRTNADVEDVGTYENVLSASYVPNNNYHVAIDSGNFTISCRDLLNKIDSVYWPDNITDRNECYSPSNTEVLPSADSIKNLILANNDTLQSTDFLVTTKDSTISANNNGWEWARTYAISISNPNYCDQASRVIYVSGSDQSAPERSSAWPTIDRVDACLNSVDLDNIIPDSQTLFEDCSGLASVTYTQDTVGDDNGWTIRRMFVATDSCANTSLDTLIVFGRDMTPPVAAQATNDTLWGAYAQCLCDSIQVIQDFENLKTLFGISDACSGEDVSLVSSSKTLKTGEHCAYTVIIAYVVADAVGNQTTIYHAQFIQDTTKPTFDIVPHDTTLCVDPDGNYENTVTRVADEITITNLHDNCTKLQESFSVQSSMDTSRFDFYHPRGYRITQGDSDNGVRHYKQLWTVTDSCGNTTYDSVAIHVRPLPKITRITNREQTIIYGEAIAEVWIYHQYSDLSITGLNGIGLDSLGCSVEHKKDQNNNEYDRVYGDPEFAVSNATFLVTATSHQGWGCSIDESTFSINVERRPIVITATGSTKKYDGTPLTSTDYTCTTDEGSVDDALVHDDVISRLSFSGSQTNVGSCTNTIGNAKITAPNDTTIDKTSNYWIEYYDGTLTVTENDTAITVTAGSGSRFYDGTPFTLTAHDDFTVTGVPDALTWTATADGTVTNIIPGEGEKPLNEVTSFHIFDADGHDVTGYFTNITYQSGTLAVNPVAVTLGDGWQAIATPVHAEGETYWTVSSVFATDPYDLFRYDEPTATWQNYKTHFFTLSPARGYIYRTVTDVPLIYDGMPNSEASYSIALTAGAPNDLAGWNLVGNPYPFPVHLDCPYYGLLPDGSWEAHDAPVATDSLAMGQAVLVHTTAPATLTFYYATRSTNAPAQAKGPLPALPKGLCLSGDCDDSGNDAITQSHNQTFAHLDGDHLIVEGEGTLEVYDALGRRLFTQEISTFNFQLSTSAFPGTGVYLLRLSGQSQKVVIK